MHAIYASCGILAIVFLYIATMFLAVNSVQRAAKWFDEHKRCRSWPQNSEELVVDGPDQKNIACVVPDLARSKSMSTRNSFEAKGILREAYQRCAEDHSCSE